MKGKKLGLILMTALLTLCVALVATACNKPETYTLSFVVDGETIPSIVSEAGKEITPPTAPEKDGMTFVGWFLNDEGESVELPTVMPAENRTYYGRYEEADENEIQIPENLQSKLNQIDSDNHLYIADDGVTVYIEYNGKVAMSELSSDAQYAEFSVNQKDYCAVIDHVKGEYQVYAFGYSKEAYILYIPMDNSFNFERCLFFDGNTGFHIYGDYTEYTWIYGIYNTFNVATNEYNLSVTIDYTNLFDSCRVRLTKRLRQNADNSAETLIYNAFTVYESEIAGTFTSTEGGKLELDGYGFGTFTDANGKTVSGVCESTEVASFGEDLFVTFLDTATNESQLFCLLDTSFMSIGKEIGFYLEYNVEDNTAGYYYLLLFGNGTAYVYYYNAENSSEAEGTDTVKRLGTASYEVLENEEFKYTFTEREEGVSAEDIEAPFNSTFNFKLTTYGSGSYESKAFSIYNPNLAGTWTEQADKGNTTITLDGYGNATHSDGNFSGVMQKYNDLLLITDAYDNQRIFRFDDSDKNAITFRQIGLEIGNYETYSYVTGFDENVFIYLNGEGSIDYYVFDPAVSEDEFKILSSGTYTPTDNADEYNIVLENGTSFKVALRYMNFGNLYYPDWRKIYVKYDPALAGTYYSEDGTSTLELDGYGLNGVYTEDNGRFHFSGEFAKEWNLVTLLCMDDEGYDLFTFKIFDGNKFVLKEDEAGVYYLHQLDNDLTTDEIRLFLDGDGNAYYAVLDGDSKNATYEYVAETDDYLLTFADNTTMRFNVFTSGSNPVFVEFNENWYGKFVNDEDIELFLDGYGNVLYYKETESVPCTVFGNENSKVVTFRLYGLKMTFALEDHTFKTAPEHVGIYYPYVEGTISGYTRFILNTDNTAELQTFDKDEMKYNSTQIGQYSKNGVIYTFTPDAGNGFKFKLANVGGYDVYRTYDGREATLKGKITLYKGKEGEVTRDTTLILDGYGSVVYKFWGEDDEKKHTTYARTREGYYFETNESPLYNLVYVATNDDGVEYATYYIKADWDNNTFEIYYEE